MFVSRGYRRLELVLLWLAFHPSTPERDIHVILDLLALSDNRRAFQDLQAGDVEKATLMPNAQ
jgi:hypothetical protein